MKKIETIIHFISHTGLHAAFSLSALLLIKLSSSNPEIQFTILAFSLLACSIYLHNKLHDYDFDTENLNAILVPKVFVPFLNKTFWALASVGFILILVFGRSTILLIYLGLFILGYWYNSKIIFINFEIPRLKNFLILKNIVPAFCWSIAGGLIPCLLLQTSFKRTILSVLHIFLIAIAVEVSWDIRDLKADLAHKVKTIANTFSPAIAKRLALFCITVAWLISTLAQRPLFLNISYLLHLLLVFFIHKNRSPIYYQGSIYIWLIPNLIYLTFY